MPNLRGKAAKRARSRARRLGEDVKQTYTRAEGRQLRGRLAAKRTDEKHAKRLGVNAPTVPKFAPNQRVDKGTAKRTLKRIKSMTVSEAGIGQGDTAAKLSKIEAARIRRGGITGAEARRVRRRKLGKKVAAIKGS